jgi:hypothetical protein
MYTPIEADLVKLRINEAREWAAHQATLRRLRVVSPPLRVVIGLALVRIGRWLAGSAGKRTTAPRRATA